jgi:type IV pilus assembly protein PilA
MKKQKGFSLIELLIVVAIILIIAAIAIPNLMRSRMAANESSAVGSLRTINTAEVTFNTTYGIGFGPLASLGSPAGACAASATQACLIDSVLTGGAKSGYNIATSAGQSGQRSFCSDQSGVIRGDPTGSAAPATCGTAAAYTPLQ